MSLTTAARNAFLKRYEAGPAQLREAWNSLPAEARAWRPAAGKWSAHEVVVHCADSEAYGHTRIRLMLANPEPLIVGYDENAWARVFDYQAHGALLEGIDPGDLPAIENVTRFATELYRMGVLAPRG